MVLFYNQADQDIYKSGIKFLPQEKYRMGPYTPVVNEDAEKIQTSFGLPAASNFNDGGSNFSPSGNIFGYGTRTKPGDPYVGSFKPGDPYAGQSGYYGSPNYVGGLPGNYAQKGPGRSFQYEFTKPDDEGNLVNAVTGKPATNEFYRDYSLTPRKELPGFLKAAAAFVPFGMTGVNFIENKMNPTGPMTADDNPYNNAGTYGIAGLTGQQKGLYDALASQGLLFEGPGGIKSATGKNIVSLKDDYIDNRINDFYEMTEEGFEFDEDGNVIDSTGNIVTGYKAAKFKEAYAVNNFSNIQTQKQTKEFLKSDTRNDPVTGTKAIQNRMDKQEDDINKNATGKDVKDGKGNVTSSTVNPTSNYGKSQGYKGGNPNPHTKTGWSGSSKDNGSSQSHSPGSQENSPGHPSNRANGGLIYAKGGRVGYFYGGLASIL